MGNLTNERELMRQFARSQWTSAPRVFKVPEKIQRPTTLPPGSEFSEALISHAESRRKNATTKRLPFIHSRPAKI